MSGSQSQQRGVTRGDRWDLPVAREAAEVIVRHLGECCNPGLMYDRYATDVVSRAGRKLEPPEAREAILAAVIRASERAASGYADLQAALQGRWAEMTRGAQPFEGQVAEGRFVTGIGGRSLLETGFRFHRIYGVPIIPGSGLKGLARTAALIELAEFLDRPLSELNRDLEAPDGGKFVKGLVDECRSDAQRRLQLTFRAVFGTPDRAGQAVFFDAILVGRVTLEVDVMTPHYGRYYDSASRSTDKTQAGAHSARVKPPADYYPPIPVTFLTVGAGSRFRFAVGWRGAADPEALLTAVNWLRYGLQSLGAGAKTAAGYGYFKLDP